MTIRSDAAAFEVRAIASLTSAASALPDLDRLYPGSASAAATIIRERIEALVTEAESTMDGWTEAVAQAGGDQAEA